MSANRFTVACCMRASGALAPRSCVSSSPHDHCTVPAPNTSAPLAGAMHREAMGRGARTVARSEIEDPLRRRERRGREPHQARRTHAVVEVLVPLVADRLVGQRRRLADAEGRDGGAAPEAHLAVGRRHRHRVAAAVDGEDRPGQRVLRPAAVGRRAEARIAPGAGPHARQRIDLGVGVRLLVRHQRAVRRRRAVDAGLPARLPEDLVAAEEREVDAGVARRFDVGALAARPVLVVADGEIDGVLEELGAAAVGVDAGRSS